MKSYWFLLLTILFISCESTQTFKREDIVAKVGDKVLLKKDIPIIFENMTSEDSTKIVQKYTQNWVKKELLLKKAEINLSQIQQDEIDKQCEETRSSLTIHQYEQEMIQRRMNSVFTDAEIQEYYDNYPDNFLLKNSIVKALYLKIPASAPNIDKVRKWYKSDDDDDLNELENYGYQYANKYDDFEEDWISFDVLLSKMPFVSSNPDRYLRYTRDIETSDSLFHYFAHIRESKLKSTVAPLEYVRDDIERVIYNQRKIKFIQELENSLYQDAISNNEFVIY
ncbi:MAG: hypothetical protein QNK30_00840 [Bacteroidales bacterium]|nr:hypothetical protein [Bacteroidales bacterium]